MTHHLNLVIRPHEPPKKLPPVQAVQDEGLSLRCAVQKIPCGDGVLRVLNVLKRRVRRIS